MKNVTFFMVLAACMTFTAIAHAGENGSASITAEKLCSSKIDIFNADNIESLLGLPSGQKLASYQVVLCTPGEKQFSEVFKYDSNFPGGFKNIMDAVKQHTVPGSMLFVDEIKTTDGEKVPQVGFYLR